MGLTKKYGQPFSYSEGDTRAKSNTRFSRAFFDFLVTLAGGMQARERQEKLIAKGGGNPNSSL